jgi:licheninase
MTVSLSDEQAKNWAASLRNGADVMKNIADALDPPVVTPATPTPEPIPTPLPTPSPTTVPDLDPRFTQVAFTDFPGSSLPSDFYAYQPSDGNEGKGKRHPSAVSVRDGNLVITAKGDVSGGIGQNVKQQYGLWEIRARFPKGAGTKPCILLWPGTERDSAGKPTWPYQIEYDLVETNSERNGGFCNVHYGTTNTQTGPHNFAGDLTQWHVYGCELTSEGVVFYLDGNVTKKLTGEYVRSKHPHRLGIQLDVASDGRTGPDTDMIIDWVRVARFN